jgi:hypothetical protein
MTLPPTESGAVERHAATRRCNECNEALEAALETIQAAGRLAMVATNALTNGDLHGARETMRDLQQVVAKAQGAPMAVSPVAARARRRS